MRNYRRFIDNTYKENQNKLHNLSITSQSRVKLPIYCQSN